MSDFGVALNMCISMFTIFPLPVRKWDDRLRKLSTACLPLAGLLIGGIWLGIAHLVRLILPDLLAAAFVAATPFVLTGFMHLDGYMDTSDAMLSWRDREARLRILKDVHTGAFAVVMLAMAMLFQFAACASLKALFPLLCIPVLSRCGSALSVLFLKPLGHSEYAAPELRKEKPYAILVLAMAVSALLVLTLVCDLRGLLTGLAVLGAYALAMWRCVKGLGGVSGDLAGFSLTLSELAGLIVLCAV